MDSRCDGTIEIKAAVFGDTWQPQRVGLPDSIRDGALLFSIAAFMGHPAAQHDADFASSWHEVAANEGKGQAPKTTNRSVETTLERDLMPM